MLEELLVVLDKNTGKLNANTNVDMAGTVAQADEALSAFGYSDALQLAAA